MRDTWIFPLLRVTSKNSSGWKGLQEIYSPTFCSNLDKLCDRVARGFIQLGLENLQEWRWHKLSGNLFHCLTVIKVEKVSPCLNLFGFDLWLLSLVLFTSQAYIAVKWLAASSWLPLFRYWGTCLHPEVISSPAWTYQVSSVLICTSAPDHVGDPSLSLFQLFSCVAGEVCA